MKNENSALLEVNVFSYKYQESWLFTETKYVSGLWIAFDAAAQNMQTPTRLTKFPGNLCHLEMRNVSTLKIRIQCKGMCLYCGL